MIPLTDKLGTTLFKPLAYNNMLATGRIGRLAYGIRRTNSFISFTLTMWKRHGVTFTIQWLKGSSVAIQKCLGKDILPSLRVLTPELPLNGLSRGLPRVIPVQDRVRIRAGHVPTIRFWLGLFNLYRVLKAPGVLKLNTITGGFTGDREGLRALLRLSRTFNPFRLFTVEINKSLAPVDFVLSKSASPSNKVSWFGILTDTKLLRTNHPRLWETIREYLRLVGAQEFLFKLDFACSLSDRLASFDAKVGPDGNWVLPQSKSGRPLFQDDSMRLKDSLRAHGIGPGLGLSQFAIKEEAAGKLRLFALMDSITQSAMRPLHDYMFDLLRLIPNDGTFDQEASIKRSQDKAIAAKCAYSFDLTAATDRLPVILTAFLFSTIVGIKMFGGYWRNIMVKRPFAFNSQVAKKLNVSEGPYYYEVGQPMGALSSWPGLAITHHWIVQLAAYRVYQGPINWNTEYEVLGDDIVIFNLAIAEEYKKIMAVLGCGINMNKSIVSHSRPVFEFAKRTCWGSAIVSGISMAQIRAGWRVGGRVANALQFAKAGLLDNSVSLLTAILSRNTFSKGRVLPTYRTSSVGSQKALSLGVLALLGERFQSGIIPLRTVMHAIIDPFNGLDLKGVAIAIPIKASLQAAYQALVEYWKPQPYFFSNESKREPKFLENEDKLATQVLHSALNKVKVLRDQYNWFIAKNASEMFFPLHYYNDSNMEKVPLVDLPGSYLALVTEIEQFFEMLIGLEMNYKDHPESIYQDLYQDMDSTLYYVEALELSDRVDSLEFKLKPYEGKVKPGKTIHETAPILVALRGVIGTQRRRWLDSAEYSNVTTLL